MLLVAGTYGDVTTQECLPCPSGCASCTSDSCTSCIEGWRTKSGRCVARSNHCHLSKSPRKLPQLYNHFIIFFFITKTAVKGYYNEEIMYMLVISNYIVFYLMKSNGTHIFICVVVKYIQQKKKFFLKWVINSPLLEISDPEYNKFNLFLHPDEYASPSGTCEACHSSCLACIGTREDQCLHCAQQRFLMNSQCVQTCPSGFFAQRGRCLPCAHGCETCSSYSSCSSCSPRFYLHVDQCIASCPDGWVSEEVEKQKGFDFVLV